MITLAYLLLMTIFAVKTMDLAFTGGRWNARSWSVPPMKRMFAAVVPRLPHDAPYHFRLEPTYEERGWCRLAKAVGLFFASNAVSVGFGVCLHAVYCRP